MNLKYRSRGRSQLVRDRRCCSAAGFCRTSWRKILAAELLHRRPGVTPRLLQCRRRRPSETVRRFWPDERGGQPERVAACTAQMLLLCSRSKLAIVPFVARGHCQQRNLSFDGIWDDRINHGHKALQLLHSRRPLEVLDGIHAFRQRTDSFGRNGVPEKIECVAAEFALGNVYCQIVLLEPFKQLV